MSETISDQVSEEQEKPEFISREELKDRIASIKDELDELDTRKSLEKSRRIKEDFIHDLWAEHKKFQQVFSTESGSVYFGLEDGGCFRVKRDAEWDEWDIQPITNHLFFVDDETAGKILDSPENEMLKLDIPIQDCKLGVSPFEFEIEDFPEIQYDTFEKTGEKFLRLKGDKYGNNASGTHVGHRITNIAI